jgi:small subunit ribosomal protein S6
MKRYEGMFILKPGLSEDEFAKASSSISDTVTKNGGTVENKEDMGLRQMAYAIKKEKQGRYLLVYFSAPTPAIAAMEKAYKLNESILRPIIFNRGE